ncbi:hypothetical protein [Endozoicomonas sp. SESOKO1]|uniref:hypothetical protein n=1 Tax=Endozoicomonas sp. SESOKO1 TaxID=2828742 RepID=UPI002148369D|nr:hypothetical protein [Endozoicomonas sp. SESOKO1]
MGYYLSCARNPELARSQSPDHEFIWNLLCTVQEEQHSSCFPLRGDMSLSDSDLPHTGRVM